MATARAATWQRSTSGRLWRPVASSRTTLRGLVPCPISLCICDRPLGQQRFSQSRRWGPEQKPGQAARGARVSTQSKEVDGPGEQTGNGGGNGGGGGGGRKGVTDGGGNNWWRKWRKWPVAETMLVAIVTSLLTYFFAQQLQSREKTSTDVSKKIMQLIRKRLTKKYDPEELAKLEEELGVPLLPRDEVTLVLESTGDSCLLLGPSRCGKTTSVKLWGRGKRPFLYCSIRGYPDSWLAEALGIPGEYAKLIPDSELRTLFLSAIKGTEGKPVVVMDDVQCLPTEAGQKLTADSKKLLASFITAAAEKRIKLVFLASEAWVAAELSTVSGANARVERVMVQQPPMAVLGEYLNRLLPQVLTPEQHGLIIQTSERNVGDLVKVVQTLSSMRAAGRELTMDNVKLACYRLYEPDIRRIETFLESVAGKLAGKDERAGVKMAFSLFKAALESGDGKVQLRTLQSRLGQKFDSTLGSNVAKALVDWNVFAKGEGVWAWHLHAPRIKHALAVVLEDKSGPDDLK
ncbi:hypothetical protein KFL_009300020 [Klebsormidium nitens]|uniref:Uncharacterized protein n=1 Tax=Klebsormidium nitens TaxID=105231 RepID=A0A1Y1IML5_KLENI|nr:hypothetical protein KFL_009300020 [Klebsormidium nitens]|eukprot:GAQ92135.1 hypothetical protein KFL_009300020 [Klebsormidium nitens]